MSAHSMTLKSSVRLCTFQCPFATMCGLILARRLQTLLDIAAASLFLGADGLRRFPDIVCDTLTGQGTVQMQPSARPVHPRAWTPRSGICSSGSACNPLPAVPERPLPAVRPAPAAGPLSFESTVPTLRRLWRCLLPAQTVRVCLWCPTSRASARLSWGPSHPRPLH